MSEFVTNVPTPVAHATPLPRGGPPSADEARFTALDQAFLGAAKMDAGRLRSIVDAEAARLSLPLGDRAQWENSELTVQRHVRDLLEAAERSGKATDVAAAIVSRYSGRKPGFLTMPG